MSNVVELNTTSIMGRDKIELIKRTVAKGASDDELSMFMILANRYSLDPFLKEIWCIKRQKKGANGQYENDPNAPALIMTSRDGYLKIAQNDPDFDGLKSFVVKEGDHFEIDAQTDQVVHKFGAKRGKILGAWAMCSHKKRKPSICFVDFEEYNANNQVWQKYPSAMIQKVAEVFVLKRQFNINGLVTQEEMGGMEEPKLIDVTEPKPTIDHVQVKERWKAAIGEVDELLKQNGYDWEIARALGPTTDPKEWTIKDVYVVKEKLENEFALKLNPPQNSALLTDEEMDNLPI